MVGKESYELKREPLREFEFFPPADSPPAQAGRHNRHNRYSTLEWTQVGNAGSSCDLSELAAASCSSTGRPAL